MFNADISGFTNNDFTIYSDGKDAIISRNDDVFGGFLFICASEDNEFYSKKILKNNSDLKKITQSEYETLRIEYGIPKFGKEMTNETNPLECGLEKYVSFTKGCYIGQEVIARLDTYDKISKHMVGFKIEKRLNLLMRLKLA